MTYLTTLVVKLLRMRKQWISGPLPSRVGASLGPSLAEPRLLGRGEGLVKCLYATCVGQSFVVT